MTEAVDYVEALNQRLPVAQYKPRGAAAKTMKALADELTARLQASRDGVRVRRLRHARSRGGRLTMGKLDKLRQSGLGQRRREHGGRGPGPHRPRARPCTVQPPSGPPRSRPTCRA